MKSKLITLSLVFASFNCFSEDLPKGNAKVEKKFFRPSLSACYIKSNNSITNQIFQNFKSLPIEARFDNRAVEDNLIQLNLPQKPQKPSSGDLQALVKYNKSIDEWNSVRDKDVLKKLEPFSRAVMANIFSRDLQGNLSHNNLMNSAAYSATDAQAIASNASSLKGQIYEEIVGEILKRSYIVVYDVTSVKNYEQYYNELELAAQATAAKTGKPAQKVNRTQEGWLVDFDFSIYKINWNDSIEAVFYKDIWMDASTEPNLKSTKKSAFDNMVLPLNRVLHGTSSAIASQTKEGASKLSGLLKRKTMDELLAEIPGIMQDKIVFQGGRKIEDFKIRGPIYQEYPTTVKLGSKEGLYFDERFFVYEIQQDKNGKEQKNKVGVLRVSKIAKNDTIATGNSLASTFKQQGGRSLYSGLLVELKEDYGLGLTAGYGIADNFFGGVNIGAEARLSSILKSKDSWGRYLRGVYVNVNITYNAFSDQNFFKDTSVQSLVFGGKSSGNSITAGASLSRETYFTKKGNLYLMPEVGFGIHSLEIDGKDSTFATLNAQSYYVNFGVGMGWHLSPTISLFVKANSVMKLGYSWTDKDGEEFDDESLDFINKQEKSSDWGFNKLTNMSLPINLGLRIRF